MSGQQRELTEAERKALLREWSKTPVANPRYQGATPAELLQRLRRARQLPRHGKPLLFKFPADLHNRWEPL